MKKKGKEKKNKLKPGQLREIIDNNELLTAKFQSWDGFDEVSGYL